MNNWSLSNFHGNCSLHPQKEATKTQQQQQKSNSAESWISQQERKEEELCLSGKLSQLPVDFYSIQTSSLVSTFAVLTKQLITPE